MPKVDPIRENFFKPYERADRIGNMLFYGTALLSGATLFASKHVSPAVNGFLQVSALLGAIALFVMGLVIRLYFMPRAENQRLFDFFGRGFNEDLGGKRTEGYYNNDLTQPMERLVAQVLENALNSKEIVRDMCCSERWRAGICISLLLFCVALRQSEYDLMIAVTQLVLSENVLSRLVRLEWLRCKCEEAYEGAWAVLSSRPTTSISSARTLAVIGAYEAAKANAGILFDSKVFEKLGPELEQEWQRVCVRLNIAQQP